MSKTLSLTFSERLVAIRLFNEFHGTFTQAAVLNKDVPQFAISKSELEAAPDFKATVVDAENTQYTWNDPETAKELSVEDETADYLKGKIAAYDKFQVSDVPVVEALKTKLQ